MTTLLQLIRSVLVKFITAGLIAFLGLGAYALWLFQHDNANLDLRRNERMADLAGKRQELQQALDGVNRRREATAVELTAEDAQALQAGKVIATLHDLESTWDRFIGNPAQQKANAEQIKRMEEVRALAQAKQAALKEGAIRLVWERDGLELELRRVEEQVAFAAEHKSAVWHYLTLAWQRTGWAVTALLAVYFMGLFMFASRPRSE